MAGIPSPMFWARPVVWKLIPIDGQNNSATIKGQFIPEDYTEHLATVWNDLEIPTRIEPLMQWAHGEAETTSFTTRLWAETMLDNVGDQIDAIRAAVIPLQAYGRPPLYWFQWGKLGYKVLVMSVGGIRFTELWPDGRVKGVQFQITLRRWNDTLTIKELDPTAPVTKSLHKPIVQYDTYESLAGRYYGDPMIGVLLRQESLVAFPKPGSMVALADLTLYQNRLIEPVAYALGNSAAAKAARAQFRARYANAAGVPWHLARAMG